MEGPPGGPSGGPAGLSENLRRNVLAVQTTEEEAEACPALELHWNEQPKTVLVVAKPGGGAKLIQAFEQVPCAHTT